MIIDADAHFTPRLGTRSQTCRGWLEDYDRRKQDHFSDAENRCRELDDLGIDLQVQNPMGLSLNLTYDLEPAQAASIMQIYNDQMHKINRSYNRLVPNLWLAMQDINASVQEIYRNLDRDFFAVHVSDLPAWGYIDGLERFWQLLESEAVPLYLHLGHTSDLRLPVMDQCRARYQQLSAGAGNEQWMLSVASMIDSGLLYRYPGLKIVLAERDINWFDDLASLLDQDVISVLRKNFWFTIEPEQPWFRSCAEKIGYDRLLFSTDWPHDHDTGGANRYHDVTTMHGLALNEVDRNAVFCNNYRDLAR